MNGVDWQDRVQSQHEGENLLPDQSRLSDDGSNLIISAAGDDSAQDSTIAINSAPVLSDNDLEASPAASSLLTASSAPSAAPAITSSTSGELCNNRRGIKEELREWRGELIACLIFILSLLAIFLQLFFLAGNPLPQWSINTVISVYSVMLQGFIVYVVGSAICQNQWRWFKKERSLYDVVRYDEAGRDPLGSVKWLFTRGFCEPLTSLGAIILISSLLIDPFIQQLVQYVDGSINLPQAATIPRTNFYYPIMIHEGPLDATPLPDGETAWNSGLFSIPTDVNFDCSTGNCTFSTEYSTIGYCSECNDTSKDLIFNLKMCENETSGLISTLPSGLSINYQLANNSIGLLTLGVKDFNFEIILARTSCSDVNPTLGLNTYSPIKGCNSSTLANSWSCRGYGAASCLVGPCIQTYNASIQTGHLTETLLESTAPFDQWGYNPYLLATIDTHCISTDQNIKLRSEGYVIDPQSQWLAYNLSLGASLNLTSSISTNDTLLQSMIENSCIYMMDTIFLKGFMEYFLTPLFEGTVTSEFGASGQKATYNGPQVLQHIYNFGYTNFSWVDSIFSNASTSLTNHIRQSGDRNFSKPAIGIVSHFATCVQIDWNWISLPATLAVLTLILLFRSICVAGSDRAPVWKSSPLAFYLHGDQRRNDQTEETSMAQAQVTQIPADISNLMSATKESARTMTVQLDTSELSIRLLKIEYPSNSFKSWPRRGLARLRK